MKPKAKPCKGMTFEEFLFLLPQGEWKVVAGCVRDKQNGAVCPICHINNVAGGPPLMVDYWIAYKELGLGGRVADRVAIAADGVGSDEDVALLWEYCGV